MKHPPDAKGYRHCDVGTQRPDRASEMHVAAHRFRRPVNEHRQSSGQSAGQSSGQSSGQDARPGSRHGSRPGARIALTLRTDLIAVREALRVTRRRLRLWDLTDDGAGMVELALAETMNNVVVHAHLGSANGTLRLSLRRVGPHLLVHMRDDGRAMPGGVPPDGLPPLMEPGANAPRDGGFGWFLIRSVASSIRYRRQDGWNNLCFRVPLVTGQSAVAGPNGDRAHPGPLIFPGTAHRS